MTPPMLMQPIHDASAWRGDELAASGHFSVRLDAEELAEIDQAVRSLEGRTERWWTLGIADFPFRRLAERLNLVGDELEDGRGFALIRGVPVDAYTPDQRKALIWGIGLHLGEITVQNQNGDFVGEVTPKVDDIRVRGFARDGELLPHCDPADVVSLFSIRKAKSGGVSSLVSTMTMYNEVLAHHPEFLEPLYAGYFYDLENYGLARGNAARSQDRLPTYSYFDGKLSCCLNPTRIERAIPKTDTPLTTLERAALDYMVELGRRPDLRLDMLLEPGDIQFANNHLILHSRSNFEDEPEARRFLLRLWINTKRRKLAPHLWVHFGHAGDTRVGT